jgi:hypothetical protein
MRTMRLACTPPQRYRRRAVLRDFLASVTHGDEV